MAPCSANQHLGEAEQQGERVGEENHEEWAFLVNDRRVRRRREEEGGEERADAAKNIGGFFFFKEVGEECDQGGSVVNYSRRRAGGSGEAEGREGGLRA